MTSTIAFDVIARDKATTTFSRIGKASDSARSRLVSFGKATAGLVGFTTLTTAAAGFIRVGADYSTSLNKIQALAGLTDKQLDKVASTLEAQSGSFAKMGQTTGDAAGGMVELVKAGLSAKSALQAVQQTMVLAKAGELDIADASSLVANTLNTFGLKARDAGKIANYLANAANISSADVADLGESMKYVGPVAAATGVSLAQTSAILAELSNSGIDASNAGTGFRKFLLSLQAPSGRAKKDLAALKVEIFDSAGKMKPLSKVIDSLGSSLSRLTDKQRQRVLKDVFGLQGVSSATVILKNGSKGLAEYTKGVEKAGAAQRLANANSKGFAGSLRTLKAEVISTAQAEYRQLEPSLEAASAKLQAFFVQMRTGKGAGGDLVDALKDLATVAKTAAQVIGAIPGPVKKLGVEALIAYYALNKLGGGFSGLGGGLTSSMVRIKQFRAELSYSETRMAALSRVTAGLGGVATNVAGAGGMALLFDSTRKSAASMGALEAAAGGALSGAALGAFGGPIGAAVGAGIGGIAGATVSLWHSTKAAGDVAKASKVQWQDYATTLNGVTGATTAQTKALIFQRLQHDKILTGTRNLGISDRKVIAAVMGNVRARRELLTVLSNTSSVSKQQRNQLLAEIGALSDAQKKTREQTAATKNYGDTLKGLPRRLVTEIKANGIQPTMAAVIGLNNRYNLTPKQVRTVLEAANVAPTKANIQKVIDKAKEFDRLHPKPKIDVDTRSAKQKLADLNRTLDRFLGKAGRTSKSLYPPGYNGPKPSYHHSTTLFPGTSPRASTWTTGSGFNDSGSGSGTAPRVMARDGEKAGTAYVGGLIRGLTRHQIQAKSAADKLKDIMSKVSDKIANLKSIKADFKSTFTSDSIFGADLETSGSVAGLLKFQSDQQAKAQQLLADVKRVKELGLSKSLLTQLQSQGSAGADQLHLLAQASASQIKAFNSMDSATQAALQEAGLSVGNGIRGGSISADIRYAEKQNHLLYSMLKELEHLSRGQYVVSIGADGFIKVLRSYAKSKGTTVAKLLDG